MTKKVMMVLCGMMLMLTMCFVAEKEVRADQLSQDRIFRYEIKEDNTIAITDYYGEESNVTIPETVDGYTVTEIGDYAFYEYSDPKILETIELPDTVVSIGEEAFSYCENLKTIVWPDSLQSIGSYAFEDCISLEKVTLPDTVAHIGDEAFAYCSSLKEINIPKSMTTIPYWMFYDCSSLTKVTIPETVTSIDYYAFAYCTSLVEIDLPQTLTYMDSGVFAGCSNLTDINIPDSVTYMGSSIFSGCDKLTEIELPDSLEKLSNSMFYNSAIEEMTIPDKFTTLPKNLFSDCDNLKTVHLPDTLKEISSYAFSYCDNLESIEIPEGVTELEGYVFAACTGLKSVKLPETLTKIDGDAFVLCTGLESITLPSSVKEIDDNPFTVCKALKEIKVDKASEYFLSQEGVLFNKKEKELTVYPFGKTNNVYTVPSGVVSIGASAFAYAEGALNTVELPESVEKIDHLAFCAGVFKLGDYTPGGTSSITNLKIYNPDCHIFDDEDNEESSISFYYGEGTIFEDISIYGYLNSTAQTYAEKYNRNFIKLTSNDTLTDPSVFGQIEEEPPLEGLPPVEEQPTEDFSPQQPSGNDAGIGVNDNNIVTGSTEQPSSLPAVGTELSDAASKARYTVATAGATLTYKAPINKKAKKVTIPAAVTIDGITYKVTDIAPNAFKGCKKMKKITIGAGVTTIGKKAFAGCKNIKNIIVKSKSLKKIGKNAFKGINKTAKIKVPKNKLKAYKKLFKKAKLAKSINITK